MAEAFFPFNPRAARLGFALGALGCAALTLWALVGTLYQAERMGQVRALISFILMIAFLRALFRIRPRPGWGVTLDARGVVLSRPFAGEPTHLPWSAIARVHRGGQRGEQLVLLLTDDRQVRIARHLFARRTTFEALFTALRERVSEPLLDA